MEEKLKDVKIFHYRPNGKDPKKASGKNPKKYRSVTVAARTSASDDPNKIVVVAAWARVGTDEKTGKVEQFCRKEGRETAISRLDAPGPARIVFQMNKDANLIESLATIATRVSKDFFYYEKRRK